MFSSYSVSWWEPNKGIDIFLGKQIKPPKKQNLISRYLWGSIREVAGHAGSVDLIRFVIPSFLAPQPTAIGVDRLDGETATSPSCQPVPQTTLRFCFTRFFILFLFEFNTHAICICSKWYDCWLPVCVCVCVCRSGHSSEIASNKLVEHAGRATVHLLARQPLSPAKCIRHHWQQGKKTKKQKNNRVMRTFAAIS